MASASIIAIKSLDHSLFGIGREMLYVPLTQEEKFHAKAVIDVFAYRSAKALAAFLLLFVQYFFQGLSLSVLLTSFGTMIYLLWIFVTTRLSNQSQASGSEIKNLH